MLYVHIAENRAARPRRRRITARAEAQLLRLSVLYAVLDGTNVVDVEHLDAAWALWSYCEQSAFYIWGDASGDPDVDRLVAAVAAAGRAGLDGTRLSAVFSRTPTCPRSGRVLSVSAGW